MMAQYLGIKAQYPDALLFYRMGDFYELFFDDAVAAAQALDIALTKRGKHEGEDIPMCGVPVQSAEGYLLTLIRKGFRVAVGEQLENPAEAKKRGNKSVVKRDVVRLVTPGTLTEDALLDARRHNYLCAVAQMRGEMALAWADISTGAFHVMPLPPARLGPELARLSPSEVLVCDDETRALETIITDLGLIVTPLGQASFDSSGAEQRLLSLYGIATLDAFGNFERVEVSAMGALVDYLEITQKGQLPRLQHPQRDAVSGLMQIDAATRRNLELTHAMNGGRAGSLLSVIDRSVTPGGARLLDRRLSAPTRDLQTIQARLDAIDWCVAQADLARSLREALRHVPDMERALSRLALDRGRPRDLAAIRDGLEQAEGNARKLDAADLPDELAQAVQSMTGHGALADLLGQALVAEPPLLARDGGFISDGFDSDLDEARKLRDNGRSVIAGMQKEYAEATGIPTLRIKHNNVLGYFIETTATHAQKMQSPPLSDRFIHRQTTANQVRFTTVELSEIETRIHNAGSRAIEIELGHYASLTQAILDQNAEVAQAALGLSTLDVAAGLANLSAGENWCRPKVDQTRAFEIVDGRHPVVERALRQQGNASFIANSCTLTADEGAAVTLLTGPNMAGKSTFLRQNALIALLAQIGSHVPAASAHIGMVSQIFSRVGAADDLARGRSTFMVEMVETAAILNQADDHALVILDEIGRGTATYDGLSIAWATLEHLHDVNKVRGLFATHYHELTALAGTLEGVTNATVAVKEWGGEVIFLHEVRDGAADRSYGVQVAQLAGLPAAVVARARHVLDALEKGERNKPSPKALIDDLPLFSAAPPPQPVKKTNPVDAKMAEIQPDTLSPRDALDLIYELKRLSSPE